MRFRRSALPVLLLAVTVAAGCQESATPSSGGKASAGRPTVAGQVALPPPTGPYKVGTTSLHLVDHGRRDPWTPSRARELMVSVWYPASASSGKKYVPQMTAKAAAHFGSKQGAATSNLGMPPGKADWGAVRTHATADAPVARKAGRLPVVLYSSGLADPRTWNTTLVEDLASRGYAVVTIDHTAEASEVEFPGGRLVTGRLTEGGPPSSPAEVTALLKKTMSARVADARFVLDRLPGISRGRFGGAFDLGRVGMAGQSAGGFTAAQTMHDDRRVRAGVNMDGQMDYTGGKPDGSELSTVARDGLDRPLLLMGTDAEGSGDHTKQPSWNAFWRNTRGWKGDVTMTGSRHATYTDAEALLPPLAEQGIVPQGGLTGAVGTVRPARAIAAERAYVASFFDRWLRGRDDHLLDGASPRFPEMRFTA
ncbi:alpha/beta hydrolase family protein [Actinomadura violacea]|uniref:Lipase n=1 Tax=Actinomadura violacea TaxID=2819934 RepID=A0ABS3S3H4_9ACTN|nr:lipase [Actinomadura violacea]MBO2463549.1 lipase [Actinomadura violacea]